MAKSEERKARDWRSSLSQLDAWVLEEEAAVTRSSRTRASPPAKQADAAQQPDAKVIDARRWPRATDVETHAPQSPGRVNGEAGVVGLARDGTPLKPAEGLFTAEEEAFIAQFSTWLRGRPNADVILEEVWHLTVGDDAQSFEGLEDDEGDVDDEPDQHPASRASKTGPADGAPKVDDP